MLLTQKQNRGKVKKIFFTRYVFCDLVVFNIESLPILNDGKVVDFFLKGKKLECSQMLQEHFGNPGLLLAVPLLYF